MPSTSQRSLMMNTLMPFSFKVGNTSSTAPRNSESGGKETGNLFDLFHHVCTCVNRREIYWQEYVFHNRFSRVTDKTGQDENDKKL